MKKRWISLLLVFVMMIAMVPQVMAEQSSAVIPDDAVEFNGNFYKIYNDSMTWTEAKAQCESLGGRLVTITSQKEMDFLIGQLTNAQKNCYWIGIEYLPEDGRWQLVSGTSAPYFNWAPNEPNFFEGNEENYVHLFGKRYTGGNGIKEVGDWNDVTNEGAAYANDFYALHNIGYICEWGTEIVASIDDLVEFNGHYYKLYHHTETWEDARDYCVSVGGHLATITSQEENDFLYQFIKDRSVSNAYFGLSDAKEEGNWKWVTDEALEYTNWGGSEPNAERSDEDYAMFYYKYSNGSWNDGNFGKGTPNDNSPIHFICEWEKKPTGNDLLIKFYPTGYDFDEDSYSFDNNSASVSKIAKKYFTTMYEPATGKLLYDSYSNMAQGGICFGMAYTTAAIYNGYPGADSFRTDSFWGGSENCSIIRDIKTKSVSKIGNVEISLHDYLKYAHIYQLSSAVAQSSTQTWGDVDGLQTAVENALASDQINVTIGMTHGTINNQGQWQSDGGHRVLAVGIDGNDILIDDPNNTESIERLTINDDNSWSYSGAWTTDGVNSGNSRIRYQTDITAPYNCLYTGTYVATGTAGEVQILVDSEDPENKYVEGMEPVDKDKMLCWIDSESYQLSNTDISEIILDAPSSDKGNLYWINSDTSITVYALSSAQSNIKLAADDLLMEVAAEGCRSVSMVNDVNNASIVLDASIGSECSISLETTGTDKQDVILTISGTTSDGTVTMDQTDSGIDITGLDDSVITLTEDGEVVDEKQIPNSDNEIHVEYDPTGNDDDVEIIFTNPFTDVNPSDYYYTPVLWALKNNITSGTTPTEFSPYEPCLRSQVVTFLWRAAGKPKATNTDNPFVDVKPTDYYYDAVLWAVEKGITFGADDTHFEPNGVCNRSQVVSFLYRAFNKPSVEGASNPFTDVPAGAWYAASVQWAVKEGIAFGLSSSKFGPNDTCNRSQVVTFLYRAYN